MSSGRMPRRGLVYRPLKRQITAARVDADVIGTGSKLREKGLPVRAINAILRREMFSHA